MKHNIQQIKNVHSKYIIYLCYKWNWSKYRFRWIWNSFLHIRIQHHCRYSGNEEREVQFVYLELVQGVYPGPSQFQSVVVVGHFVQNLLHYFALGYCTSFSLLSAFLIKRESGYGYKKNMVWVFRLSFKRLLILTL